MDQEHKLDTRNARLEGIRRLISQLQTEIASLEAGYAEVLLALRRTETKADRDDLTGLLRRNAFFARWRDLVTRSAETGEGCGVLLLDLDYFKTINDHHGHGVGDEVLKRVANLLAAFESPVRVSGRLGGEEFIVAMIGGPAELRAAAELMRKNAARLRGLTPAGAEWKCTVSVGVASMPDGGADDLENTLLSVMKAADSALYAAKHGGRNRVACAA